MEGTVYTITPRLIMPGGVVDMPRGLTRRFWMTVRTPADARPGVYKGTIDDPCREGGRRPRSRSNFACARESSIRWTSRPVRSATRSASPGSATTLRPPAYNQHMVKKSLHKMREYGFTACSGLPSIAYRGFDAGKPVLDFAAADASMKLAKELGFLAVTTYGGGVSGFNAYTQDLAAMSSAGFTDYAAFVKAIYSHDPEARRRRTAGCPFTTTWRTSRSATTWFARPRMPRPIGRRFPRGRPISRGPAASRATTRRIPTSASPRRLGVVSWNDHDEAGVQLLHKAGADWAFYNGGNRWTYGTYMYKAAKQFGMKFRLSWHWNVVAGDPYYALDCREDDYAWCNASPDGQLIPSVEFERLREGLDDYRRLITLARLAERTSRMCPPLEPAANVIADRMAAFKLGQRDHDALFPPEDWTTFRRRVDDLIEALRK